jgi:hypothetical protein
MLTKPCLMVFRVPGTESIYWKEELRQTRKNDPVVKLFVALETAIAYSHKAANPSNC